MTKILIRSKGRPRNNLHFYFNNSKLEIVSEYKYLGIFLSRSGNFKAAKKHISEQANKALFSLIKKNSYLWFTIWPTNRPIQ